MNETNKFIISKYLDENKDNIIQKYAEIMPISKIAELYEVARSTIYLRLVRWDVRINKYTGARGRRLKKSRRQRRKFSKELLMKMKENSRINNEHIKHIEFIRITKDQRLVNNILCKSIIELRG